MEMDASNADEYYETAIQIFDYCGAEKSGTLRVKALMDKIAPFIRTNKDEYSYLKSLLDPTQDNPEISATQLAAALSKYSDSQKLKVDLDESFNLRSGPVPQDSDSGISTDGFQQLEELQSELREKSHEAHQLRSQLDFTDRQHEEVLTALTAELDSLRVQLAMLREENMTLMHVRCDYEELCERLGVTELALEDARRELDTLRRRGKALAEQAAEVENEKLTLQEQVQKSKSECHRINEMYAGRQATLLERNEVLAASHAELSARAGEQDRLLQQLLREKVLLEMELKDLQNKTEQPQLMMDRSVDVSYTEDQMLTALDSLNADSRFSQDNQLLDEDSFVNALKDDQGRATNMSLFDEIRLSFHSNARQNPTDLFHNCERCKDLEKSVVIADSEAGENEFYLKSNRVDIGMQIDDIDSQRCNITQINQVATQTDKIDLYVSNYKVEVGIQTNIEIYPQNIKHADTQTDTVYNNNDETPCSDCYKCTECGKLKKQMEKLMSELKKSRQTVTDVNVELGCYEENLVVLQKLVSESNGRNCLMQSTIENLQSTIVSLEATCANQTKIIEGLNCETCCVQSQTDVDVISVSTQFEAPCMDCQMRNMVKTHHTLKTCFWESTKWLFQLFAIVCFVCALIALYGVTRKPRCRDSVPWRWLLLQDFLDLLLRVEYGSEVPM